MRTLIRKTYLSEASSAFALSVYLLDPRKVQPRSPQLAASSCSGQSTLRSDRASGRSSSAQWWGDSSPGWASGLKKLQLTHILATVNKPALCKDVMITMKKLITHFRAPGEEAE